MMTSSNENIFRVIGHLCGEFTGHRWIPRRPVTRSFDVFFHLSLNERLSKQWWFETPLCPLWRHFNGELNPGIPYLLDYVCEYVSIGPMYIVFVFGINLTQRDDVLQSSNCLHTLWNLTLPPFNDDYDIILQKLVTLLFSILLST